MKDKLSPFLKKYPLFLYLLPVFFVLHGCLENYGFVPADDAILLTIIYLAGSLVFFLLSWLIYRNWLKAGLVAFLIMCFHFFFGSVQDSLRHTFPGSFLSKYIFILPVAFVLFVGIVIFLKRRKKPLHRLAFYLNSLFILLIVLDLGLFAARTTGTKKNQGGLPGEFTACDQCSKPDVYLIIADEYAGNKELTDIFHFDDSVFLNQLRALNFHVIPNSSSNYNYTPYSIASILNMDYPDFHNPGSRLATAYQTINDNRFLKFLNYHQYKFYNYSDFDFTGHPTLARETFLPVRTRLITSQTFLSRLEKELRYHLIVDFKSQRELRKTVYDNRDNNEKLMQLLVETAGQKTSSPKFVFTHLMMPHYPYYYDKNGNALPFDSLTEGKQVSRHNYIGYLQYSNKRLLQLIEQILQGASTPPIIILMGDHGFRHFTEVVDQKYYFCNLVSFHLPGNNYAGFSDSLTNVNLLRTILNESFAQHLPLLKDTTYIMDNP